MEYKILNKLDEIIEAYAEPIQIIDGLYFDQKETLKRIEFYANSKYLSGDKDELGREKPFYNICNYRVTVAKTATDLDVKDIRFEPESLKDSVATMLYNKELFKYLKESNFSQTLNEMGLTRPKYGGVIVKKSEDEDGELRIEVSDWKNISADPSDILGGVVIEDHYLQASELSKQSDVWDEKEIKELLKAHNKFNKNKPARINVKEVTGEFPKSFNPDEANSDENNYTYQRMCFYIGVVNQKKFLLHYEVEEKMEYKYLPWERMPGRGLGRGVMEDGFQAQIGTNDTIISMKNVMELSTKVILSTNSKKISGNALTGVQSGHIFELEDANRTITSLNLAPSAYPALGENIELWNSQYDRSASTYDANTGEAPTAGTPYSQTALLNQVANSPFEYRREEWGIFLNEIMNDWIFPYLKRKILKKHDLVAEFDDEELAMIDEAIANSEGKKLIIDNLTKGEVTTPEEVEGMKAGVTEELGKVGKKRSITIPDKFLDIKGRITCNITGELKNKQATLQSLDSILKTIQATFNPNTGSFAALDDPRLAKLFGQIVELSGVPITFGQLKGKAPQQPQPVEPIPA